MTEVSVIKATGERELFDREKLLNSIRRAGVPEQYRTQVLEEIKGLIYPDIPTSIIYRYIINSLRKISLLSGRYSLKQALMDLGPSGFPFENFIAKIFENEGYKCRTDVYLQGRCIKHEVDVLAEKGEEVNYMECKYHNLPGRRTDAKIALYVQARFEDIMDGINSIDRQQRKYKMWLTTNTKCTQDAISYCLCKGIGILSWSFPEGKSLRDLVESKNLHPVTCLINISSEAKKNLIGRNIVLCRDILDHPEELERLNLHPGQKEKVIEEVKSIISV